MPITTATDNILKYFLLLLFFQRQQVLIFHVNRLQADDSHEITSLVTVGSLFFFFFFNFCWYDTILFSVALLANDSTVFSLSIRTPQLLTIYVLKFEPVQFTTRCCV